MIDKYPSMKYSADYNMCSRAQIFRRNNTEINDIESFKNLMRYNNYIKDPFSFEDPSFTISARADLGKKPSCFGAFDCKVTKVSDIKGKNKKFYLYGGPTNIQTKQFKWSETPSCNNFSHIGLVDEPKYDWFIVEGRFN